ncbi:3-carboxy-cis,cis-muconate cycloisomerase [Tropicimonas aquimaris]|uniref:3-carboxy-cis,cis-muconate cycloisomerase n=1 Tax=Tropicimonas aquimaris TaxID=914152 RepID=A0ABW3IMV2_9RHOB
MNPLSRQDHLFGALFADPEVESHWSTERFLSAFLQFESALARALAESGVVTAEQAGAAVEDIASFAPDVAKVAATTLVDGVPVPELLRQLQAHSREECLPAIHRGATSQDLIDTAFVLILRDINALLEARIESVIDGFSALDAKWGAGSMMGRTRMQAAVPILVSDRIRAWTAPLSDHLRSLTALRPRLEVLQYSGAVGNRSALGPDGDAVARVLGRELGLGEPGRGWHTERGVFAEYAGLLSMISATLGKFGQDICLMAQQQDGELEMLGGGTSSAMPHKQNPVLAELLVTHARFNATMLPNMHHAMIHEQERSGAAWTLEWMTLPQMTVTTGKALRMADDLQRKIVRLGA